MTQKAAKAKTILIIEAPGEDRKVIGDFLEALGYEVSYADSGSQGLHAFSKQAPDLVVVEILLSGMNGLAVCKTIKEQAEWAKVIVLSKLYQSHSMRRDATEKYGADGYLEKPFELHELRDAVVRVIGESGNLPKEVPEDSVLRARPRAPRREVVEVNAARKAPPEARRPVRPAAPEPSPPPPPPPREPEAPPTMDLDFDSPFPAEETDPESVPGSGVFTPESLAALLRSIALQRVSGTLKLVSGELAKLVYLVDGTPVYVKSNLRSENLGNLLLAEKRITPEVHRAAVERMQSSGEKLGAVLIAMGALSPEDLNSFIARQTGRKLAGAFHWEGGTYHLDLRPAAQVNAPRHPAPVPEVLAMVFDQQAADEDWSTRLALDGARRVRVPHSRLADQAEAVLTDADRAVRARVDGRASAREVVAAAGLPEGEAVRSLYRMLTLGALDLGEEVAEEAAAPPPQEEATAPEPLTLESEATPKPAAESPAALRELRELEARAQTGDDYQVLGCRPEDPARRIRELFQSLSARLEAIERDATASTEERRTAQRLLDRAVAAYENIKAQRRARRQEMEATRAGADVTAVDQEPYQPDGERRSMAESELLYRDGVALLEQKRFLEAIPKLERACELNGAESDYPAMLGWAIYRMVTESPRTVEEAIALVKRALVLNAASEMAHLVLARIYAGEGNVDGAVKFYKKTLSINPRHEEAQRELRELERKAQQRPAAREKKRSWLTKKLW